ncbi:MAG: GNAT family N-acetyltransferase [Planctomycetes bacterium]|nr:GNAT family N-acetyltransferase [Planctomycetota bacterium]
MAELPRYGLPDGDAERRAYAAIVAQSFAGDAEMFEGWVRGFGDGVRVLRDDQLLAGLVIYEMGQFFGGAAIPTWGIAGVGVKPELRARGYAREMMLENLRENFESGPAISTLYPAAPRLYRNLGWEYAGARCMFAANLSELPVAETSLELREAGPADQHILEDLYRRRHQHENGCLDRSDLIWERVRRAPKETPPYSYIAERDGEPEGYTIYTQKRQSAKSFRYDLLVRDLVCNTPDALAAMLGLFARHRSVASRLEFYAAPDDPIALEVARTTELALEQRMQWMLRIVRVRDALQARGYSRHVAADAVVHIRDEMLPGNSGDWTLQLADGRMRVTPGGKGGPTMDIRGLAALYSSSFAPAQLRAAGLLTGTDRHDAPLAAMFAGTAPWMPDFF